MKTKGNNRAITNTYPPDRILKSQYGVIRWDEWCAREVKRIGNCEVANDGDGIFIRKL